MFNENRTFSDFSDDFDYPNPHFKQREIQYSSSSSINDLEKGNVDYQQDMSLKLRQSLLDEESLLNKLESLKSQLDSSKRKTSLSELKNQKLSSLVSNSQNEAKKASNELKAARSAFESNKAQFAHESRRKEQESTKLKERMQKVIIEKHKSAKIEAQIISQIHKPRSEDESLSEISAERRLVDDLIKNYEINEKELLSQNEKITSEIISLYNHHYLTYNSFLEDTDFISNANLLSNLFNPSDIEVNPSKTWNLAIKSSLDILANMYTYFKKSMSKQPKDLSEELKFQKELNQKSQEKIDSLNETINSLNYKLQQKNLQLEEAKISSENFIKNQSSEKESAMKIQQDLDISRSIIKNQEKTIDNLHSELTKIQKNMYKISKSLSPITGEFSSIEECINDFLEKRSLLRKYELKLKNDQSEYQLAMTELANEKAEVEKLRQSLKVYQINSQTADFLSTLPPTPAWLKNVDLNAPTPEMQKNVKYVMDNTPISSMQFLNKKYNNQPESGLTSKLRFSQSSEATSNSQHQDLNSSSKYAEFDSSIGENDVGGNRKFPDKFESDKYNYISENSEMIEGKDLDIRSGISKLEVMDETKKLIDPGFNHTPAANNYRYAKPTETREHANVPGTTKRTQSISNNIASSDTKRKATNLMIKSSGNAATFSSSLKNNRPNTTVTNLKNSDKIHPVSPMKTPKNSHATSISTKTPNSSTPNVVHRLSTTKICTKPGCAANYVHSHEDLATGEAVSHERKPPVPKFRSGK
ncbi:hypothetical protein BB560_002725 [Smittium megazygosporum]|uniref:Uncharacterized protein n=1 Tax=Smittium megazygosporum TaxID=133381 RepID=A0A2T9ZDZ9_9FUNG|nr:hypothetical protein BB560_002725 [Smittium megazygosporum]